MQSIGNDERKAMFCPNCGKELHDDARFCTGCGTNVESLLDSIRDDCTPATEAAQPAPAAPVQPAPAQPAPAVQSHPSSAPEPKRAKVPTAAVVAALALVVGIGGGLLFAIGSNHNAAPGQAGSSTDTQQSAAEVSQNGSGAPAVEFKGQVVQALERPQIVASLPAPSTSTQTPNAQTYTIGSGVESATNYQDFSYIQGELLDKLNENGFVVQGETGDAEFWEVYEKNRYARTPSFVTVDSMMHTYHLYFAYLMKNTERDFLSQELSQVSQAMLQASEEQYKALAGTEWEEAAKRNLAFFGVGAQLLDPNVAIPSSVADVVSLEVSRVQAAEGIEVSDIVGQEEDYSQYIVRGYYEGDELLERYFRAMMWYGRMNFSQKSEDLDRSALLMTLALDQGSIEQWGHLYAITSFFAGASDDCGYYEYLPLFKAAYGEEATIDDLPGNEGAWKDYHELTSQMPAPRINSVMVRDEGTDVDHEEEEKGFRFMGQRFTIDAAIMQNLVYNKVDKNSNGDKRMLPNALDVPAALGSDEALGILTEKGETGYGKYSENMEAMRQEFGNADDGVWSASLYSQWLYTLQPLLDVKGEGYPSFMQSSAWTRKDLQTYLGSYTELKHDTVLYSKQVVAEAGGGTVEKDDRGYVEPEPDVYRRLANLTQATSAGLDGFGMLGDADRENLALLEQIATRLAEIADIELAGELPSNEDFDFIRDYGAQIEHFWYDVNKDDAASEYFKAIEFPAAIVTDVATDTQSGSVLELGTGRCSPIYVVVMVDGVPRIARGSVFSFYQFRHPMNDRLTDTAWREMMGIGMAQSQTRQPDPKPSEDWTRTFQVPFQANY